MGIEHRLTTPLWPRTNGEVERQNRFLQALRVAHADKRDWKLVLNKYLLAYRSTPHVTIGQSPAKLLFGRKLSTKLPEVADLEESEGPGYQQARDRDAEKSRLRQIMQQRNAYRKGTLCYWRSRRRVNCHRHTTRKSRTGDGTSWGTGPVQVICIKCEFSRIFDWSSRIQLFRERLSYKRGEPYATMSKVIMGYGGFTVAWMKLRVIQRVEWNTTNPCIRNFSCPLAQTLATHNTNRHFRIRFYTFVGQPLSKQLYATEARQLI